MAEDNVIKVQIGENTIIQCDSVILIPKKALEEAGYLKVLSMQDSGSAKHEYHAMSQVVYFQHQDDELNIDVLEAPVVVMQNDEKEILEDGMIIFRDLSGSFQVFSHLADLNKRFLEIAYRFCTRWVRLDI